MNTTVASSPIVRVTRGAEILATIAGLAALVVIVFHDSYAAIWQLWQLSTYQYALLIVPAAAYLIWARRAVLAQQSVEPWWPALAVLFLLAIMWHVSRATAVQAVEHAVVILSIPAIILAALGRRVFATIIFSLLLLLTTIPIGEALSPILMVVTADIATALLKLVGTSFSRHGQYLSLPGGDFHVADVCAGVRYLLAGSTLALLFSYLSFRTLRARALFIAITAVLLVLGNGIRAFIVMTVASATRLRYFAGQDHVVFGMLFFAFLLTVLFWIANRYYVSKSPEPSAPELTTEPSPTRPVSVAAAVVAAVLALISGRAMYAYGARAPQAHVADIQLPALAGCSSPGAWRASWTPRIQGARIHRSASYACSGLDVHVLVVAYSNQSNGSELVGQANAIVPKEWWEVGAQTRPQVVLGEGESHAMRQLLLGAGSRSMLVWHWYEVNGTATTSEYGVKLREALAALQLTPVDSRAYLISVVGPAGDVDDLLARAQQVVRALRAARS